MIETKFSLGQEVWFISGNKAVSAKVVAIDVHLHNNERPKILYTPFGYGGIRECALYGSKRELLESL